MEETNALVTEEELDHRDEFTLIEIFALAGF